MNPLTNIKNLQKLNERELQLGIIGKKSWHDEYKDSAWIFVGGLPFDLTEGDILCVFSQYGEIVNINLVRDHKSGKSKGFAFLCFEDQRSTVLSVDNLNGIKVLGRTVRVDHVKDYKMPKEHGDEDDLTKKVRSEGCAPKLESSTEEEEEEDVSEVRKTEKKAKKKKKKKEKKRKRKDDSSSNEETSKNHADHQNGHVKLEVKKEKFDPGYDRAVNPVRVKEEVKQESGREHKPPAGHYSRGRQSRSQSRSHSPAGPSNKNKNAGGLRNQRHDSDSNSDSGSSPYTQKPSHRQSGRGGFGRSNQSGWRDDTVRGDDRDERRGRRREDSKEREQDRERKSGDWQRKREGSRERRRDGGRERSLERDGGRERVQERSRERMRNGSRERVRERSRERDRDAGRDDDRIRNKQDRYHSSRDQERDRDRRR